MKRIGVVAVLAVIVAFAVAGPAIAFSTAPQDGAYVFPFDGGSWVDTAGGQMIAFHDPGTPIPAGTDVYLVGSWIGFTKGLIKNIPDTLLYKATVGGVAVVPSYAIGKAYWTPMYIDDSVAPGDYPAFNAKIGAKAWSRDWWAPVGAPKAGTYTGVMYQKFAHTTTDLMTGYYPDQHKPFMIRAGVTEFPFSFTVQ